MGDQMLILEFGLGPAIQDTVNVGIDASTAPNRDPDMEFEGGRKHT
jgi:hypothetical protein